MPSELSGVLDALVQPPQCSSWTQPVDGSHESSVQSSPSSQDRGACMHAPSSWQESSVQASPSSQRKLSGTHSPSRQTLSTQGLGGPLKGLQEDPSGR